MSVHKGAEYRSLLRETFRETVKRVLAKHGPLETYQIYNRIRILHPDLCDDDIECTSGGDPEWKKQVRWAQRDLKHRREIDLLDRKCSIRRPI